MSKTQKIFFSNKDWICQKSGYELHYLHNNFKDDTGKIVEVIAPTS